MVLEDRHELAENFKMKTRRKHFTLMKPLFASAEKFGANKLLVRLKKVPAPTWSKGRLQATGVETRTPACPW
jgi:hypothetical protein